MTQSFPPATIGYGFSHAHLLGIERLKPGEIAYLLDRAAHFAELEPGEAPDALAGSTVINLFFENSTRTRSSFEIAAQRLGADVVNMYAAQSSVKKGETLIDTAMTLNAMKPDVLVVRHSASGGAKLLSRKVDCAVINAGDGTHEHPTQALLDDAYVSIDEWLAEEVQDAFAAQETTAFVTGDGVNKPKGFLAYAAAPEASYAWGQVGYLATGVAGGWPASNPTDKLIDLIYAARTQYRQNGRFVMNRRTVSAVRKIKDSQGNYIWNAALQPGQSASLLGFPVTEIEAMPDVAANSLAVAFGDFEKGYLIVDRAGVRVLRDPYSAKPHVLFYTTKRVGGGITNFEAIKLLKCAA
mgnify:CR=1 FL=1